MNIVEINRLTKYYGKHRGIIDADMVIPEGDLFGFVGPNGSGKSTTLRCLMGFIKRTRGSVKLFGKPIEQHGEELFRDVGYMSSDGLLYPEMRVKDLIAYSTALYGKDCKKETSDLIERFAIDRHKKIEELSLGNRRKLGIVCAFAHRPRLLVLDEPTSGLDPLMQKEFLNLVVERNRDGATVLFSSHVLSEVQSICKNASVVREGRIIETRPIGDFTKASAKRVYIGGITSLPEIEGVIDFRNLGDELTFLFNGDIKKLISVINELPVTRLSITEPSLEEIFMHFYEKRGETK